MGGTNPRKGLSHFVSMGANYSKREHCSKENESRPKLEHSFWTLSHRSYQYPVNEDCILTQSRKETFAFFSLK